jgi:hypothetical protein
MARDDYGQRPTRWQVWKSNRLQALNAWFVRKTTGMKKSREDAFMRVARFLAPFVKILWRVYQKWHKLG